MIIGHELMVQIVRKVDFGLQILEWYETFVSMKEPGTLLGNPNLTQY